MSNTIKGKAISGIVWTTISTAIRSIVALLQVSILTRYLTKDDFGIVAIATLFIGFTQIFIDLGISSGILHKQNISKDEYSSLFWLNCITGISLTLLLIGISPVVASIYKEPSLTTILSLLSLSIFFSSIGSQQSIVMQKTMRFREIAIITIISNILTLIIAILLVKNGFGIYSLVLSTVANSTMSNIMFLILGLLIDRKNIYFHFNIRETIPFLKIGVYSLGSSILDYFSREIDIILISSFLGTTSLGAYSLCKKIVTMIYGAVGPIMNKVFTPILASIQDNIDALRRSYYKLIESLSLLTVPIFLVVSLFSSFIINILYGEGYMEYTRILSLMSLYYAFLSTGCLVTPLQISLGRTDLGFYWTICRIVLSSVFVYIGVQFNLSAVVVSLIIMHFVSFPISWRITIYPILKDRLKDYFIVSHKVVFLAGLLAIPFFVIYHNSINAVLCIPGASLFIGLIIAIVYFRYRDSYAVSALNQIFHNLYHK